MTQEDYRLNNLERVQHNHEERLKGVEMMTTEQFTKISTILEIQTEMNKKQDDTLGKINDNLTHLNHTTIALGERVEKIEDKVEKANARDSISVTGFLKKAGWTVFTLIAGGLIGWAFVVVKGEGK